jgi:hypothetical protein
LIRSIKGIIDDEVQGNTLVDIVIEMDHKGHLSVSSNYTEAKSVHTMYTVL